MARPQSISLEAWLQAGFQTLVAQGPRALSAEGLARRLGVTKGGFYGRFGSLAGYHAAMMQLWRDQALDQITEALDQIDGPRARLEALIEAAARPIPELWGGPRCESAIRAWALEWPPVAEAVAQVDAARIAWLRGNLDALGAPEPAARLFYAAYLGLQGRAEEAAIRADLSALLALLVPRRPGKL